MGSHLEKLTFMKKILFTLIVVLSFAMQGVAQDCSAWLVERDIEFQCSESVVQDYPTIRDIKWQSGILPKGYVVFGSDGIWDNDREIIDEYVYSYEHDGFPICRYKKFDLKRQVPYTYSIPHEYGNGKVYKLENGMSFKIVRFKPNGMAKFGYSPETRKFVNSQNCYVLIVMNSTGAIELTFIMNKTIAGFEDAYLVSYDKPMKVNKNGTLLTSCTIGPNECTLGLRVRWVIGENRLILYSKGYQEGTSKVLAEACGNYYVAPTYKVLNPPVTDRGLYDVAGSVKAVKEHYDGYSNVVKFTKTGKVSTSKRDITKRDQTGRLLEWKIYEKMSEPQYPCYHEKEWKYDTNGNVIYYGVRSDFADGYANHILYECDNDGNIIKQVVLTSDPENITDPMWEGVDTITYKYQLFDKYGNWSKRSCINSGVCDDYETGKTIKHNFTYEETCEREYDDYGNWVTMTTTRKAADNSKNNRYITPEVETRTRTITYYQNDMGGYMMDPN